MVNTKQTRLDYIFNIFNKKYNKIYSKYNVLETDKTKSDDYRYAKDKFFNEFLLQTNILSEIDSTIEDSEVDKLFKFFVYCDPSENKEYVSWFINLYSNIIKRSYNYIGEEYGEQEQLPEEHRVFFEDLLTKVKYSLEVFSLIKKTKVLSNELKDINNYKTIYDFVKIIKPYTIIDDDGSDDNTHTLNHKELTCVNNYVNNLNKEGKAELVFENKDWVIVITHDKEANKHFGQYTSWCTAGTRYGDMFSSYNSRGKLFVLIKKGFGSKKHININPEVRLQFHFEDDVYMDATDSRININQFLYEHSDIKDFFKNYIINTVLPYRVKQNKKQSEDIKYLLKLGYGDEIIDILKQTKPESVDFSGYKIESKYLERLGELTTLKRLNLMDCGLTSIPESIQNLVNLEKLKLRNNENLTLIPKWINKLTKLEYLDLANCGFNSLPDFNGCVNLNELVLDGNKNLTSLPNLGNLINLNRVTASSCSLTKIDDTIMDCVNLYLFDIHSNVNLNKIPLNIGTLSNLIVLCLDDTNITGEDIKEIKRMAHSKLVIIKYGD